MKRTIFLTLTLCLCLAGGLQAQFNLKKAASAGIKTAQAVTLSDKQIEGYVKEYINWSDSVNPVCADDDPYAIRLNNITKEFNNKDGLNIKAYRVVDVNAFACADGSIRVFAGLMDIMSDEEILGVIGHEIGHVKLKHTKESFRTSLMASALRDGIGSTSDKAAALSGSQLGDLGENLTGARFSQKHEREADSYGYEFLKARGINPWAMALSFEKLHKMEQEMGGNKTSKVQQLFATHPEADKRAQAMADRAKAEGYERPAAK